MMLACVIIAAIIIVWLLTRSQYITIKTPNTPHSWRVIADFPDSTAAAAVLERVHSRAIRLLRHLRNKYCIDDPKPSRTCTKVNPDARAMVDSLLDNYNFEVVSESDPRSSGTSYTINKGTSMYLCVREKEAPYKIVDENILMFVMIHELAHIANYNDRGHTDRYWAVFKFILHEAVEAGVIVPIDYSKTPVNYCGLHVNYNPYFDSSLPDVAA